MASARSLYRLAIALGTAGAAAMGLAAATAFSAVDLAAPSAEAVFAACRRLLPADLGWGALVVLATLALGVVVLLLWVRSLARQLRASRSYLRRLAPFERRSFGHTPALVFDGARADAFCAGYLRPRIYLSRTAVELLDAGELEAVLAHERHHRHRRDPLRLLMIRALADALFFMPALRRVGDRYAALAELAADEAAVRAKSAGTLTSALLAFGGTSDPAVVVGIGPERADHLLGRKPPSWELPLSVLAGAVLTVGGIVSLAVIADAASAAGSQNLVLLIAESCMLLALTVGLVAVATVAARARA